MCALLTQLVYSDCFFYVVEDATLLESGYHILLMIQMNIFPVLMLFGLCPNGCLSHSYFAPGWSGESFGLLKKEDFDLLPSQVNGKDFPFLSRDSHPKRFLSRVDRLLALDTRNTISARSALIFFPMCL